LKSCKLEETHSPADGLLSTMGVADALVVLKTGGMEAELLA
jgi:hypothetical protein